MERREGVGDRGKERGGEEGGQRHPGKGQRRCRLALRAHTEIGVWGEPPAQPVLSPKVTQKGRECVCARVLSELLCWWRQCVCCVSLSFSGRQGA